MEQPKSNPTFCTNNCGFYGSSQFEGMCSKCYRDHVSRSYNSGRPNSFTSYYSASNTPVTSSSQNLLPNDDQDDVLGQMDEDMNIPNSVDESSENKNESDNSEESSLLTTKQETNESHPCLLTHVASAPTLPISISRNIDMSTKNDSSISLSVMESSSLGADSLSSMTSSSVDRKKRSRCTWETCNKKLGLTGFDCRCGGQFCSLHRYANEHNCTFDYKEHGQNEIRKNMPVVQAERVRRI